MILLFYFKDIFSQISFGIQDIFSVNFFSIYCEIKSGIFVLNFEKLNFSCIFLKNPHSKCDDLSVKKSMEIKKIWLETCGASLVPQRPETFDQFIGQEPIKSVLVTAIDSAQKRQGQLWHILFSWPSGFWKTTMAGIISHQLGTRMKVITGYALSKPSELVSVLNSLESWDILFIDEIHRLKPTIEEVLYIAMEDFVIDMVMPEWWNLRLPINPFTLVGATTKPESLSQPMKNRFVYHFHYMEYTPEEQMRILKHYLERYHIFYESELLALFARKVAPVPREIHNLVIKMRDFVVSKKIQKLAEKERSAFLDHIQLDDGGMMPIHKKYLELLSRFDRPVWVKTLALQLGVSEKTLEEDIEPLLLRLGKIEKSSKGRTLV